jgi:putative transposase
MEVAKVFKENRSVYGSRKIKAALKRKGIVLSRRRISRIMGKLGLESAYTCRKFKVHKAKPIDTEVPNELNRVFNGHSEYAAIVSDLTYVRVNYKWNYICILLDLFNREIIGYSAGPYKDAQLVLDAFATVPAALDKIQLFHTDRGGEFNNNLIDEVLETFGSQDLLA